MINNNDLKAVILAAGKGTRMRSSIPKVLHKIFGKTMLERVIDNVLKITGISEIFVIVGHQAEEVSDFINKTYNQNNYSVNAVLQEPQLGTGDAIFKVHERLKDFKGSIIVLCGDTPLLTKETLSAFVNFHKEKKAALTVLSALTESPQNYGRIIRDSDRKVKKIVEEKDATAEEKQINEINAGIYCMEWEIISPAFFDLTANNAQGEYYLTDIVDWACKKGLKTEAFILENDKEILGVNSKLDLAKATKLLNARTMEFLMDNGVTVIDPEATWISPETKIGRDTVIYPGCFIEGANIIGKNCSIGPFAHIRDNVKIADNVRIGNFVEVKNSEIGQSTNAAHLSYIGDSRLGNDVNIGAGTITANYDALTKKKNRTEIEDGVKIGSNSVLVAPVKISKNSNIAAGSVITKDVPEYALAIARGQQKIIEGWVIKKIGDNHLVSKIKE